MTTTEAFALLDDKNTSAEILSQLSTDENPFVLVRVAAHMNTSTETLTILSKSEIPLVKQFVAEHINTPTETLVELSKDCDLDYWIAGNPKTPVELLNGFSKHENENIRSSVAVNPSTPTETLDILMIDENEDVRAAVMKNPVIAARTAK
jgi:hypothetical protein